MEIVELLMRYVKQYFLNRQILIIRHIVVKHIHNRVWINILGIKVQQIPNLCQLLKHIVLQTILLMDTERVPFGIHVIFSHHVAIHIALDSLQLLLHPLSGFRGELLVEEQGGEFIERT